MRSNSVIIWLVVRASLSFRCNDLLKKGKAVPLQAWSGPQGSRKLRFPDFMTTAQDGSRLSTLRTIWNRISDLQICSTAP